MSAVRKVVSLHPKTVTKISENVIAMHKTPKAKRRTPNSRVKSTVWHDGVDPLIIAWVRENKIHWRRIEVVDAKTIIVHHPKH